MDKGQHWRQDGQFFFFDSKRTGYNQPTNIVSVRWLSPSPGTVPVNCKTSLPNGHSERNQPKTGVLPFVVACSHNWAPQWRDSIFKNCYIFCELSPKHHHTHPLIVQLVEWSVPVRWGVGAHKSNKRQGSGSRANEVLRPFCARFPSLPSRALCIRDRGGCFFFCCQLTVPMMPMAGKGSQGIIIIIIVIINNTTVIKVDRAWNIGNCGVCVGNTRVCVLFPSHPSYPQQCF